MSLPFLQVAALALVAVALTGTLAHALELPGKLRLGREDYLTVQGIYYPGFTRAGLAEPAAILALLLLLVMTPSGPRFWLTLGAFLAMVAVHAIFWLVTQPVNRIWVQSSFAHSSPPSARMNERCQKYVMPPFQPHRSIASGSKPSSPGWRPWSSTVSAMATSRMSS